MRACDRLHGSKLLALAVVCAGAVACHPRARRTPDDTLVVVVDTYIEELDPRFTVSNLETRVSRLVAAPLVSVDQPSLEAKLELAERVERVDDLTWDVTVRGDARFADGAPVGARDVVYTFRQILDSAVHGTAWRAFNERLSGVEELDERRVRFHLRVPLATFVTDLDFGILDARIEHTGLPPGWTAGAGPYRVAWMGRGTVVLHRNEHYFGGPARLPWLVLRTFEDANTRLLVLVGGAADLAQNGTRLDILDDVAAQPRLKVQRGPSALLTYLIMNDDDPILRDVRVRQAIAYAIDRDKIIAHRYGGAATPATGLIPPWHWAYEPDVPRYGYDPARARRLLDEAGHPAGPDGRRFTLVWKASSDAFRLSVVRVIAQQLGDVGIDVDLRVYDWETAFHDIKQGNYQLGFLQSGEIAEPDMYWHLFHSERIPTPDAPDLGNRARYRNAEVDRLIELGRRTLDRDARKPIYSRIQKIVAEEVPVVPLWHEDNVAVENRDLMGYELLPNTRFAGMRKAWKLGGGPR